MGGHIKCWEGDSRDPPAAAGGAQELALLSDLGIASIWLILTCVLYNKTGMVRIVLSVN